MIEQRHCIGTVAYMGGIPAIPEPFVWSWTQFIQFNAETLYDIQTEYIHYTRARVSLHSAARTEIAAQIRGSWVMMFDCDMTFDPDILGRLLRLMNRYNLEAVSGIYPYKSATCFPVASTWNGITNRHEGIADWPETADVFEVSSVGAGCLLIRRRVIERVIQELGEDPFGIIPPHGEDHSFFMRLRKLLVKAYLAPRVQAGHISQVPLYVDPSSAAYRIPRGNRVEVEAYGMPD
jgi:GT2 family glycosyltransferase